MNLKKSPKSYINIRNVQSQKQKEQKLGGDICLSDQLSFTYWNNDWHRLKKMTNPGRYECRYLVLPSLKQSRFNIMNLLTVRQCSSQILLMFHLWKHHFSPFSVFKWQWCHLIICLNAARPRLTALNWVCLKINVSSACSGSRVRTVKNPHKKLSFFCGGFIQCSWSCHLVFFISL